MARVPVFVVHDEVGGIISVARPAEGTKAIILGGSGQSVIQAEVEEDSITDLVAGNYRIDIERGSVVSHTDST